MTPTPTKVYLVMEYECPLGAYSSQELALRAAGDTFGVLELELDPAPIETAAPQTPVQVPPPEYLRIRNNVNGNVAKVNAATWRDYVARGLKDPQWDEYPHQI